MAVSSAKVVTKETTIHHLAWDSTAGWVGLRNSNYDHLLVQDVSAIS
jgi:hypothetical protein